jgi:hypothetical protein
MQEVDFLGSLSLILGSKDKKSAISIPNNPGKRSCLMRFRLALHALEGPCEKLFDLESAFSNRSGCTFCRDQLRTPTTFSPSAEQGDQPGWLGEAQAETDHGMPKKWPVFDQSKSAIDDKPLSDLLLTRRISVISR